MNVLCMCVRVHAHHVWHGHGGRWHGSRWQGGGAPGSGAAHRLRLPVSAAGQLLLSGMSPLHIRSTDGYEKLHTSAIQVYDQFI